MSLDVYLSIPDYTGDTHSGSGIFIRENGQTIEITRDEWDERYPHREPVVFNGEREENRVYHANITHNLNVMAKEAGIYEILWRPDELGIKKCRTLADPLYHGLKKLRENPERFKKFNPSNGWGSYEALVDFVEQYLLACIKFPDADIEVSR